MFDNNTIWLASVMVVCIISLLVNGVVLAHVFRYYKRAEALHIKTVKTLKVLDKLSKRIRMR